MFDYWHSGWHMWWMGASWFAGLVMLVVFLWAWVRGTAFQESGRTPDTAESILKRRYAQGEISTDEYEQRLSVLRK